MQLSPNFSLAEFCRSDMAARHGINNELPIELYQEAKKTADMLERIRHYLGGMPMTLSSGYRCPPLNALLGSDEGSDHPRAMAADIRHKFLSPTQVARSLAKVVDDLEIGQLILEFPDRDGWVHVSTRRPLKLVNRIITITGSGVIVGVGA